MASLGGDRLGFMADGDSSMLRLKSGRGGRLRVGSSHQLRAALDQGPGASRSAPLYRDANCGVLRATFA